MTESTVLFTVEQIDDIHHRRGTTERLPDDVRALRAIGVERYDDKQGRDLVTDAILP